MTAPPSSEHPASGGNALAPNHPTPTRFASPPPPQLAFRVGIAGHRPDRLQKADLDQLGTVIQSFLQGVKEEVLAVQRSNGTIYERSTPVLRAISPLAEGSDRIFAQQALGLGFELCCVMPFLQAEFEKDFAPLRTLEPDSKTNLDELAEEATKAPSQWGTPETKSLTTFRTLLSKSRTQFELEGSRSNEGAAYAAASSIVRKQSDVLIVVWDGERRGKRGGTEETLDEARQCGVPIVWIDAHAPHLCQLLDATKPLPQAHEGQREAPDGSATQEGLRKWVCEALSLPEPENRPHRNAEDPKENIKEFYAERKPRWTIAVIWKAFRDIVADRKMPKVKFSIKPLDDAVKDEWPEDRSSPTSRLVDDLRPFYAWPDGLAIIYADRYRSAFIFSFLLAAAAVGMALMPVGTGLKPHGWAETMFIAFEFAFILIILGLVFQGRRLRWHERWLDYRLTAELVRHLRLVAPLGGGRPFPQVPAHWATYGQPGASWMAWYVRAVERSLGLPSAVVDKAHLEACLNHLAELVNGQITYHRVTATRSLQIEERLHFGSIMLLTLTLIACGIHLLPGFWSRIHLPVWVPPLLTFLCGFCPALGAAMAGIVNQGEFRRIAKRSEATGKHLETLRNQLEKLLTEIKGAPVPPPQQFSTQALDLTGDAARLLVNEVLDWRVVFLDQPLKPPA